jgi:hypothetical protein
MSEIRRFTDAGLIAAREFLNRLRQGDELDVEELLASVAYSVQMEANTEYEVTSFDDRQQAAEYFHALLEPLTSNYPDLELDAGLWTWLSIKWLGFLAPLDPSTGERLVRQIERYVLTPHNYQTYYRHYLSGPYRILKAHRDDVSRVRAVLATPVTSPGEVVEQIASKQDIISNPSLMSAVTALYVDPATNRLKRGSGGSSGGSPRRLSEVLYQFDQTWDTSAMDPSEILALLPAEFDRFKTA